jgi:hypothetical protein
MIRKLENALAEEVNGGLTAVEVVSSRAKIMDRLLGMQDREVRAASSLATRLRLTPPEPPCALNVMVPPSAEQSVPGRSVAAQFQTETLPGRRVCWAGGGQPVALAAHAFEHSQAAVDCICLAKEITRQ